VREHRLYQADWLVRFYGFAAGELTTPERPDLDLLLDPKTAWALRHRALFPVDVNAAPRELLLRVPGLGARSVQRIVEARRHRRLRLDDLRTLGAAVRRAMPFVLTPTRARRGSTRRGCARGSSARGRRVICSTGESGERESGSGAGGVRSSSGSGTRRCVGAVGWCWGSSDRGPRGGRMREVVINEGAEAPFAALARGGARAARRRGRARGVGVAHGAWAPRPTISSTCR
jgi:hypothetical protein